MTTAIIQALQKLLSDTSFVTNLVSAIKTTLIAEIEQTIAERVAESLQFDADNYTHKITSLEQEMETLDADMDDAEQYSRMNCLIFCGVDETAIEVTDEVIAQICEDKLGVKIDTKSDIDRSHRLASTREPSRPTTRSITSVRHHKATFLTTIWPI